MGWRRHNDGEVAVDEILDAAGRTFAERGVQRATMVDVARAAGCSRATLSRHFPNQEALHLSPSCKPENMAVPIAVSQHSELLRAMLSGLVDQFGAPSLSADEIERRVVPH